LPNSSPVPEAVETRQVLTISTTQSTGTAGRLRRGNAPAHFAVCRSRIAGDRKDRQGRGCRV